MTEAQTTRSGYADVNRARLYYETTGEGHPIVLIHAALAHSEMWNPQWAEFARGYSVVRYDMRGFGKSRMPQGPFSHTADLYALLNHLSIRRAHLVGASLGGQMATSFTVLHPDMVSALVTLGSGVGGRPWSAEAQSQSDAIDEVWESGRTEEAIELELRMWVDGPRRGPEQVDPAIRESVRRMMRENLESEGDGQPEPLTTAPTVERLAEIQVPTFVIVGEEDVPDKIEAANLLETRIRGARKVVMPGTAHVPSMEKPGEFNTLVLDFLRGV